MARLIDADALLKDNESYLCKPCKEKGHDYHEVACRACWVDDMRLEIDGASVVDAVEVVHGRWEDVWGGKYANKKYRCSVCRGKALYDTKQDSLGNWSAEQELTPICPHCGAKMDGDGNG